ncbi:MAG: hypothetical protein EOO11_20925 [Chitinophagaceae bacterium]|nr:MAG: hypothetical protein EOO11_20925 [Chitinophagaceae bacterium]
MAQLPNGDAKFFPMSPEDYERSSGQLFLRQGFYEQELKRTVQQFGNVAHVQSAYQFRFTPGGKIEQRGINYITLVKSEGRWWIANLSWQDEEKDLALPKEMEK